MGNVTITIETVVRKRCHNVVPYEFLWIGLRGTGNGQRVTCTNAMMG